MDPLRSATLASPAARPVPHTAPHYPLLLLRVSTWCQKCTPRSAPLRAKAERLTSCPMRTWLVLVLGLGLGLGLANQLSDAHQPLRPAALGAAAAAAGPRAWLGLGL